MPDGKMLMGSESCSGSVSWGENIGALYQLRWTLHPLAGLTGALAGSDHLLL